ncbi:hypothetical protein B0T39_09225 [Chromobacterium haemolyticum]|nr:hypothetical protein B0T39_09225 [Chromobacterium haemolyticum]
MELLAVWLIFSIIVIVVAEGRGRSRLWWFLISLVISPLLALIALLVLPNIKADAREPNPQTHVKCPDCAELVKREARKCKHCGCTLTPQ